MANTRDIKRRISSVESIGQITKAMEMVAAAKLRRAQASVIASRPYTFLQTQLVSRLQKAGLETSNQLLEPGNGPGAYIVIAGQRGLSGAYNANILRFAQQVVGSGQVIAVGRKAKDFFAKKGQQIIGEYRLKYEAPTYADAVNILKPLIGYFRDGIIGSLHLVYTEFISVLNHRPAVVQLLPITGAVDTADSESYIYEPSPEAVLERLLPRYLTALVFQGLLEAKASEYSAQRTAMKSATDNASEMIEQLTLSYNRARQTAITQEILEVVNGAQALEG
ncbi:MAG: ATP synthase F1 subunit gamma [Bacillota bacterium]|jgi:F-type H+-transporting ATPase subunit gamma|nr:ATP synthase F1 subunit gamma [Bacillota bacterium]HOC06472.1 ATP synthase F1 subunit gamma [Bacillota bacterium]HPZ23150.1 ATP synthase F1 subunit gamma [Bacillota bacterium]HQD20135.1 ATP synthase F1 subunit gamma [Bacillota bacterium]